MYVGSITMDTTSSGRVPVPRMELRVGCTPLGFSLLLSISSRIYNPNIFLLCCVHRQSCPQSRVLLHNPPILQLLRNVPVLLNPKFHCLFHKSLSVVPIMSQINEVYIVASNLFKIHFNIIYQLQLHFPSSLSHSGFPTYIIYIFIFYHMRVECPAHLRIKK
jgi:hypothetical protein